MSENIQNTDPSTYTGEGLWKAGVRLVKLTAYDEDGILRLEEPIHFTPSEIRTAQLGDGFVETVDAGRIRGLVTFSIRPKFTPPPPPAVSALDDWSAPLAAPADAEGNPQIPQATWMGNLSAPVETATIPTVEYAVNGIPTNGEFNAYGNERHAKFRAGELEEAATSGPFPSHLEGITDTLESTERLNEWLELKDQLHEQPKRMTELMYGKGSDSKYSEVAYRKLVSSAGDIPNLKAPTGPLYTPEQYREVCRFVYAPHPEEGYPDAVPLAEHIAKQMDAAWKAKEANSDPAQGPSVPGGFASQVLDTVCKRGDSYGSPADNHQLTADLWSMWLSRRLRQEVKFTPEDVCMLNILQKQSRLAFTTKDDSWLDVAGYAENVAMIKNDQRNYVPRP